MAMPKAKVKRMMALLRQPTRTPAEDAELKVLATMMHVASGGAFSLTLAGEHLGLLIEEVDAVV